MKTKHLKSLFAALLLLCSFITAQAQQPKVTTLDSTVSAISVQPQNYTYQNVYVTIQNVSFSGNFANAIQNANDSLTVNVSYSLYASKNAYDTGKQLLTQSNKIYKVLNDSTIFTGFKSKLYAKLLE